MCSFSLFNRHADVMLLTVMTQRRTRCGSDGELGPSVLKQHRDDSRRVQGQVKGALVERHVCRRPGSRASGHQPLVLLDLTVTYKREDDNT